MEVESKRAREGGREAGRTVREAGIYCRQGRRNTGREEVSQS